MEEKNKLSYLQISPESESNIHDENSHSAIPKWHDTGSGQQLLIPNSDEISLIAKAPLCKILCCHTTFAHGKFELEVFENCKIFDIVSQNKLTEFCDKASNFCSDSMNMAYKGKNLFYFGVLAMLTLCSFLTMIGLIYEFAWVSVFAILLFVFGMGCCYEIINTRARKIHEILKAFIELNDDFSAKGIEVKAGPYGTYIEFTLNAPKSVS